MSVFRGGVPYALDIKKLEAAFPAPQLSEGNLLTHSELEDVLGFARGTPRYYAVINSWRRSLRDSTGIFLVWEPSQGLKICRPHEIMEHFERTTRQKFTQSKRALGLLAWVPRERLDEVGQKRYDHYVAWKAKIGQALNSAKKEMAIDLAPVKSLPRPKIVDKVS